MLIDTSGYHIAGSTPAPAAPPRRQFLLEGSTDVFSAMPAKERFSDGEGPVYPSLGRVVFRGLEALDQTVQELGKHPTPEEVDRSNIRRLVRAMAPVVEAHRDSFPEKPWRRAMDEMSSLTKAVGRYKDVGILESEVKKLFPGGRLPGKIARRLEKTREKRAEQFRDAYKDFRKHGLEKCLKGLGNPHRLGHASPARVEADDRRAMGNRVADLLDRVDRTGVEHSDPEEFHEGRKALRRALNALGASQELFSFPREDVDAIKRLVDGFGVAQDSYIAYEWLEKEGFHEEASTVKAEYDRRHQAELAEAHRFARSGALERLRATVESSL